ncbi:hypothetical protein ABPG75_004865 [Micractinium tetrahymenae]
MEARPAFTLSEEEEHALDHQELGEHALLNDRGNGSHRPQQVFNLDLDYSDDDALLDWEQYAGMSRTRCCGMDCSRAARCLRPPQWWYTYPKRQRRCILGAAVCMTALLVVLVGLVAAAQFGAGGPATAGELELCSWQQWRLPNTVVPSHYDLVLQVPLRSGGAGEERPVVQGTVGINVTVLQATRCVVLHASGMDIAEVRLGGPEGQAGRLTRRDAEEQIVLQFDSALPQPSAQVWISFSYQLRDGLSGFYRSTYTLSDGSQHSLATTHFEANAARTAFPCFDEPAFKAVFNTEVIAPVGLQVLSNTAPRAIHHHAHNEEEGSATWHFQPTPPMSTYLVCVIIGEFVSKTQVVPGAGTSGSVNVSVWGTPERMGHLQYALDAAAAILPAYEKALGVPFPLEKMDLIAIPDFAAGAMENWGLITYRETALLVSNESSVLDRRYVSLVVAHEMAHQWFGNLVTMDYWGELWLNEGFASYFEFVGATAAEPGGEFFSTFYSSSLPIALYFDSKKSSHALSMDPATMNSTDKIESVFDAVMYDKGGAVLRMLRAWANRDNRELPLPTYETIPGATPAQDPFLGGLQKYLQYHAYNNTRAPDLWASVGGALGPELPSNMQQWTYQQGYPLVNVSMDPQGRVWLHQAPFGLGAVQPCNPDSAWWIPISYTTGAVPGKLQWTELRGCQGSEPLLKLNPKSPTWVKLNAGQLGFYRVQYSEDGWRQLAEAARSNDATSGGGPLLSSTDLAGLLEDSYSLAEAGQGNITRFLDLLLALPSRAPQEYEPWATALPNIYQMARLLPDCYSTWQRWVGDVLLHSYLAQPVANASGAANDPTVRLFSFNPGKVSVPDAQQTMGYRLLRPAILRAAGLFPDHTSGANNMQVEALTLMGQLETEEGAAAAPAKPNPIDADIRSAVYQAAARSNDWEIYHQLQEMYKAATDPAEKERLLLALGYAPGADRLNSTLNFALTPDVRSQDVRTLIVSTAASGGRSAPEVAWRWLNANADALFAKLGGDDEASVRVSQAAEHVASLFADRAKTAEVDAFFAKHKTKQSDPGYAARAKESIEANARWVEMHGSTACAWMEAQQAAAAAGGR